MQYIRTMALKFPDCNTVIRAASIIIQTFGERVVVVVVVVVVVAFLSIFMFYSGIYAIAKERPTKDS